MCTFGISIETHFDQQNIQYLIIQTPEEFDTKYDIIINIITKNNETYFLKRDCYHTPKVTWWTANLLSKIKKISALYINVKSPPNIFLISRSKELNIKKSNKTKEELRLKMCQKKPTFPVKEKNAFSKYLDRIVHALSTINMPQHHSRRTILRDLTRKLF